MTDTADSAARLSFLQIDASTREILRGFLPRIEAALPAMLEAFYAHVRQHPQLATMFGPGGMDRAGKLQREHWLRLFSGRFDADYVASVRRIGHVHSRIGLDPRWYIGAYAFMLEKILAVATTATIGRWRPGRDCARLAQLHRALTQATMLDMDLAISIYLEENELKHKKHLGSIADAFGSSVKVVVDGVASAASEMQASAGAMSAVAEETGRQAIAVASASEEASTNVQTVAAAAGQLAGSISEVARQVGESTAVAGRAVQQADQANEAVKSLTVAAARIGEVVGMINDVASQTNLLALNATIEAARAGDAGKGFAVVASEVKALANQTARATDDIRAQISQIQSVTGVAVEAIRTIGDTIRQIDSISTAVAAAVEEQGAATREIARNIEEASAGTNEVSSNIAGVTLAADETGRTAEKVLGAAAELGRQSESLRRQVGEFLTTVVAA